MSAGTVGGAWSTLADARVERRVAALCVVVFDVVLHVRMWVLGLGPPETLMYGPYYDEFWTTIWVLGALLLAFSIRQDLASSGAE